MDRRTTRGLWCLAVVLFVVAAPAAAVNRRAFATSVQGTGKLADWPDSGGAAGLAGGDAICRARAAAASLPNANTYRAWLSSADTDAYCHVRGLSGKKGACTGGAGDAAGPWYLSNGVTAFTGDLDALTGATATIYRPVTVDEFGSVLTIGSASYWTGTLSDGTVASRTCNGWISAAGGDQGESGNALATAEDWTDLGYGGCDSSARLLCLEPGASQPHTPFWSPGALAFVTSKQRNGNLGSWPEAGGSATGLAAGDAICQKLAADSHLPAPESFVAWLSTDAVQAADRLTTNGPFNRIDGFIFANSKASLLGGTFGNTLHQDETGAYLSAYPYVWTGTQADGTSSGVHCANWMEGTSAADGSWGLASFSRSDYWTESTTTNCGWLNRLYCFSNVVTLFWENFESGFGRWSQVQP